MAVRDTSILAYDEIKNDGLLGAKQFQIYDYLRVKNED